MDPSVIRALTDLVAPVLVTLILCASVIAGLFVSKHFKLRSRELELEMQFHTHEAEARLRALEMRQAATEAAFNSIAALAQAQRPEAQLGPSEAHPAFALGRNPNRG